MRPRRSRRCSRPFRGESGDRTGRGSDPTGTLVFGLSGATDLAMGQPLAWAASPVTLAEAVAIRDRSEIAGQILLGADPNIRYRMRDYLSAGRVVMVTPLEAAMATGDIGLVESLLRHSSALVIAAVPVPAGSESRRQNERRLAPAALSGVRPLDSPLEHQVEQWSHSPGPGSWRLPACRS